MLDKKFAKQKKNFSEIWKDLNLWKFGENLTENVRKDGKLHGK